MARIRSKVPRDGRGCATFPACVNRKELPPRGDSWVTGKRILTSQQKVLRYGMDEGYPLVIQFILPEGPGFATAISPNTTVADARNSDYNL